MSLPLLHTARIPKGFFILTLIAVCIIISSGFTHAQIAGDYRSAGTGNWTTLASWQRYNGSSWLTPTAGQGYPGQYSGTGSVLVSAGHTITIGNTGISTQPMTKVTVANTATLYLNGGTSSIVTFYLNTPTILVNSTTGTIYFNNKVSLKLPVNGIVYVGLGGLTGTCNNNVAIWIGTVDFANCSGAPGNIFTFAQLMAAGAGGTLGAVPAATAPDCAGGTIGLTGNFTGAIGAAPTYHWDVTAPGGAVTGYNTQNVSIPSAAGGTWMATLTVSTNLNGTVYTNAQTIPVTVNPLPSLTGATQATAVCGGSAAFINVSGLVPSTTFSLEYMINGVAQTPLTGLVSGLSGTSSFTTPALTTANNGQILRITRLTITSSPTNCTNTFTQDVVLSVLVDGSWLGNTSTDWNNAANWCGGIPTASTDVIIRPAALFQPVIGVAGGVCRKISISSGASLTVSGSNTLSVRGDWTNDGAFTSVAGTIILNGTALQTIGGSVTTNFSNLEIANAGGVRTTVNTRVEGMLTLTLGKLNLSGKLLTIGTPSANGTITGGSGTCYIVAYDNGSTKGTIRYRINDKNDVTYFFPMGDNDDYSPFTFTLNAITTSISGAYIDVFVKDSKLPGLNPGLMDYLTRYWDVTPGGSFIDPNFDIRMQYTDTDIEGTESSYYPVKTNGTDWYTCIENANFVAIKVGSGYVVESSNALIWSGVTRFSQMSGAGSTINTLPVKLLMFETMCEEESGLTNLVWSTATETNNDYFTIERSTDAIHWDIIATVDGAGNSISTITYRYADRLPNEGFSPGTCIYYRLSQTDYDGSSEQFNIIGTHSCELADSPDNINVMPNPFTGELKATFNSKTNGVTDIYIKDITGKTVYKGSITTTGGTNTYLMNLRALAPSVYFIQITIGNKSRVRKIVKTGK
ncbi:MAG: T9SS type A sorting domain-containing protein [Bacteroidota bacterium]